MPKAWGLSGSRAHMVSVRMNMSSLSLESHTSRAKEDRLSHGPKLTKDLQPPGESDFHAQVLREIGVICYSWVVK